MSLLIFSCQLHLVSPAKSSCDAGFIASGTGRRSGSSAADGWLWLPEERWLSLSSPLSSAKRVAVALAPGSWLQSGSTASRSGGGIASRVSWAPNSEEVLLALVVEDSAELHLLPTDVDRCFLNIRDLGKTSCGGSFRVAPDALKSGEKNEWSPSDFIMEESEVTSYKGLALPAAESRGVYAPVDVLSIERYTFWKNSLGYQ